MENLTLVENWNGFWKRDIWSDFSDFQNNFVSYLINAGIEDNMPC